MSNLSIERVQYIYEYPDFQEEVSREIIFKGSSHLFEEWVDKLEEAIKNIEKDKDDERNYKNALLNLRKNYKKALLKHGKNEGIISYYQVILVRRLVGDAKLDSNIIPYKILDESVKKSDDFVFIYEHC